MEKPTFIARAKNTSSIPKPTVKARGKKKKDPSNDLLGRDAKYGTTSNKEQLVSFDGVTSLRVDQFGRELKTWTGEQLFNFLVAGAEFSGGPKSLKVAEEVLHAMRRTEGGKEGQHLEKTLDPAVITDFLARKTRDGKTALLIALMNMTNWPVAVPLAMISHGADTKARDRKGMTPLLLASLAGFRDIVERVLQKGGNTAHADFQGQTALMHATLESNLEVGHLLLEYRASVHDRDANGWTALHHAAYRGSAEFVQMLCESGARKNTRESKGRTALHLAAREGKYENVEMLLEMGADATLEDDVGKNPLASTIYSKIQGKLSHWTPPADPQDEGASDRGVTKFHGACQRGALMTVAELCEPLYDDPFELVRVINARDQKGRTPLMYAVSYDEGGLKYTDTEDRGEHASTVRFLCDETEGACTLNAYDCEKASALHHACARGDVECVSLLLDRGVDHALLTKEGQSAWDWASESGRTVVLKLLPFPIHPEIVHDQGMLLMATCARGERREFKDVISRIPKSSIEIKTQDCNGAGVLHHAVLACVAATGDPYDLHATLADLITKGADVDDSDNFGLTPLHLAAQHGLKECVKRLVAANANLDLQDDVGRTALHCAAFRGHAHTVAQLAKAGANMAALDKSGQTALHYALSQKLEIDTAEALCNLGVPVNVPDDRGRTELEYARAAKSTLAVALLAANGADVTKEELVGGHDEVGYTALHHASARGWRKAAELCVQAGADVDEPSKEGHVAVHLAHRNGHLAVASVLAEKTKEKDAFKANLDCVDAEGRSMLHYVCEEGHLTIVETLLESGADLNLRDAKGRTAMRCAMESHHTLIVAEILHHGATWDGDNTLVQTKDKAGKTALAYALQFDYPRAIEMLVTHGAEWDARTPEGQHVLQFALSKSYSGVVRALVSSGAPLDDVDSEGRSALHHSVLSGKNAMIKALLEGSPPLHAQDKDGRTPLHVAVVQGNIMAVEALAAAGAPLDINDNDGRQPLHWALRKSMTRAVEVFVAKGADLEVVDPEGRLPLHYALGQDNAMVVETLVGGGASLLTLDPDGNAPMHIALEKGKTRLFIVMAHSPQVKHHKDGVRALDFPNKAGGLPPLHAALRLNNTRAAEACVSGGCDLGCTDDQMQTPLHVAVVMGNDAVARAIVEQGCPLGAQDIAEKTPLHYALEKDNAAVAAMLVGARAPLDLRDDDGHTPLHTALKRAPGMVKTIVDAGANVDIRDGRGVTPLHLALSLEHDDAFESIVKAGPQLDLVDDNDKTPLHVALQKSNKRAVKVIVDAGADLTKQTKGERYTALHIAVLQGDVDSVDVILRRQPPLDLSDADERLALHHALAMGSDSMAASIIAANSPLDHIDRFGQTPLHISLEHKNQDMTNLLCKSGADVNIPNEAGARPLHIALATEQTEAVVLMAKHARVDLTDKKGTAPLHAAIQLRNLVAVKAIVGADANLDLLEGSSGIPAVHMALRSQSTEMAVHLVARGAGLDLRDAERTVLQAAVVAQSEDVVAAIVSRGQDAVVDSQDGDQLTALHLAVIAGVDPILDHVLKLQPNLDIVNQEHRTALHCAVLKRYGHAATALAPGSDVSKQDIQRSTALHDALKMEFLVAVNAMLALPKAVLTRAVAVTDADACTPLHWAVRRRLASAVATLVGAGGESDAADGSLKTPFHDALEGGDIEIVLTVMKNVKDLEKQDGDGRTALHLAVLQCPAAVESLLAAGADVHAADSSGSTPLTFACQTSPPNTAAMCAFIARGNLGSPQFADVEDPVIVHGVDTDQRSVVHHAVLAHTYSPIEAVLSRLTEDHQVDRTDADGYTACSYALSEKQTLSGTMLLRHGADITLAMKGVEKRGGNAVAALNEVGEGGALLHHAMRLNFTKAVEVLMENGADMALEDEQKQTPIAHAFASKATGAIAALLHVARGDVSNGLRAQLSSLEQSQPNGRLVDEDNMSVMHHVCEHGYAHALQFVLDTDVTLLNKDDKSPIKLACENGYTAVAWTLFCSGKPASFLQAGTPMEVSDVDGQTMLHHACKDGSRSAITRLVNFQEGKHCDVKDKAGRSPLSYALDHVTLDTNAWLEAFHKQSSDSIEKVDVVEACMVLFEVACEYREKGDRSQFFLEYAIATKREKACAHILSSMNVLTVQSWKTVDYIKVLTKAVHKSSLTGIVFAPEHTTKKAASAGDPPTHCFSAKEVDYVFRMAAKTKSLTSLSFYSIVFTAVPPAVDVQLKTLLAENTEYAKDLVEFVNCRVEGALSLTSAWIRTGLEEGISSLVLRKCYLSTGDAVEISGGIRKNKSLQELDMSSNQFSSLVAVRGLRGGILNHPILKNKSPMEIFSTAEAGMLYPMYLKFFLMGPFPTLVAVTSYTSIAWSRERAYFTNTLMEPFGPQRRYGASASQEGTGTDGASKGGSCHLFTMGGMSGFFLLFCVLFPWVIMPLSPGSVLLNRLGVTLFATGMLLWMCVVFATAERDTDNAFGTVGKPAVRLRRTFRNAVRLFFLALELYQILAVSFVVPETFPNRPFDVAQVFQLGIVTLPGVAFMGSVTFALVCILVWWLLAVYLMVNLYVDNMIGALFSFRYIEEIATLMCNILFMPIVKNLLTLFNCKTIEGVVRMDAYPTIVCWSPIHSLYTSLALIFLLVYIVTATHLSLFFMSDTSGFCDVKFVNLFVLGERVMKLLIIVLTLLLKTSAPITGAILVLIIQFFLMCCVAVFKPCRSIIGINAVKLLMYIIGMTFTAANLYAITINNRADMRPLTLALGGLAVGCLFAATWAAWQWRKRRAEVSRYEMATSSDEESAFDVESSPRYRSNTQLEAVNETHSP